MADQTTRRVLRLNRVTSNGAAVEPTVPLTLNDIDGTPLDGVTVDLYLMPEDERRAIVAAHTRLEKDPNGGRGLFEFTDVKAANDEIFCKCVKRWSGIAGADDKPLVCNDATKLLLDATYRAQITRKIFGAEVVEVLAASFR